MSLNSTGNDTKTRTPLIDPPPDDGESGNESNVGENATIEISKSNKCIYGYASAADTDKLTECIVASPYDQAERLG